MSRKLSFPCTLQLFYKMNEQCNTSFLSEIEWQKLEESIDKEKNEFMRKFRLRYAMLSSKDLQLIMLMIIGLNNAQISQIYHIELSSLRKKRYRIIQKMRGDEVKSLDNLIKIHFNEVI